MAPRAFQQPTPASTSWQGGSSRRARFTHHRASHWEAHYRRCGAHLQRLFRLRADDETCAAAGTWRVSTASWACPVCLYSHAHQRRRGKATTVRRWACTLRQRPPVRADATAFVRIAVEQRQRGSQPRDAATWEDNTLVAFCRAARADAAVRKALELLEVRRTFAVLRDVF